MLKRKIKVGIIGGSGLDDPASQIVQSRTQIERKNAENEFGLPSSDLFQGTICGVDVVLLSRHDQGHKVSPSAVNYRANIEALRIAGCSHILASTACGSLSELICREQLVIPDSFIDRTVHRKGTFYDGTSENYAGVCHVPMEPCFDPRTSQILEEAAKKLGISIIKGGTVVTIEGPRFSSKAESNLFRQWGGHLINMTTCPEVFLAKEAGLLYASVAIVTDYDCWRGKEDNVSAADVLKVLKKSVYKTSELFVKAIELIGQEDWNQHIDNLNGLLQSSNISKKLVN